MMMVRETGVHAGMPNVTYRVLRNRILHMRSSYRTANLWVVEGNIKVIELHLRK